MDSSITVSLFAFGLPGTPEMLIIGVIAVLLFGSRLPSVARSLGKSFVEFKKGVRGIEDDVQENLETKQTFAAKGQEREPEAAPKFQPPTDPPRSRAAGSS